MLQPRALQDKNRRYVRSPNSLPVLQELDTAVNRQPGFRWTFRHVVEHVHVSIRSTTFQDVSKTFLKRC
eukprot:6225934-Pyramimonas_sp.AAC.1